MRIDVEKLAAKGFKLDLDGDGVGERVVGLGPTASLTGFYESTAAETRIRASGDELALTALAWPIGSIALALRHQSRIDDAQVGISIPRKKKSGGWSGGIACARLHADGLMLSMPSLPAPIELDDVRVEGLTLVRAKGELRVEAKRVQIKRVTVAVGGMRIFADDVELPAGVRLAGATVEVGEIRVRELHIAMDELVSSSGTKSGKTKKGGESTPPLDLSLLDQLNGKLDVDLTVDATVPIIGRRKATHHFRIPIDEGSIDYKMLEHNLSALEDAVLDFKVRDSRLCLVKDLPLVPFDATILVYWELAREELVMAKRKRVRLRRLAQYQLPVPKKKSSGKSGGKKKGGIDLRSLHFDDIKFGASMRGPAALLLGQTTLSLGQGKQPAIAALQLRGDVHYDASGADGSTGLRLDADGLHGALSDLRLGNMTLDAGSFAIGALADVTLTMTGTRPGAFNSTLRGVELSDLCLAW